MITSFLMEIIWFYLLQMCNKNVVKSALKKPWKANLSEAISMVV